jgi:hypothetical protein
MNNTIVALAAAAAAAKVSQGHAGRNPDISTTVHKMNTPRERETEMSKREIIARVVRVAWFCGAICVALAAAGLGALILGVLR